MLDGLEPHKQLETDDRDLALQVAEYLVRDGEIVTVSPPSAIYDDNYIVSTARWEQ